MESIISTGIKARDLVGVILKHVLADESRLAAATRGFVWRVRGSPLQSVNRLFAEQGRQIDRWVGEVAAQARAFGVSAADGRGEPEATGTTGGVRAAAAGSGGRGRGGFLPRGVATALSRGVVSNSPGSGDEARPDAGSPRMLIGELLALHEGMAVKLRDDLGALEQRAVDADTEAFLAGLLEFHETTAWMLRLVLEAPPTAATLQVAK